jgi:hypothetical protein
MLMWVGVQRHALADLSPGNRPGTHCIGGCVDRHRAGLDGYGKSPPPPTGACSESLYRLSYTGPLKNLGTISKFLAPEYWDKKVPG